MIKLILTIGKGNPTLREKQIILNVYQKGIYHQAKKYDCTIWPFI